MTLVSFSHYTPLQGALLCHLHHITIVMGGFCWVPPKPSLSRLNKLLSLNFFSQGKCSCPDQLGDPLLSLLQFSYIFLALWDPALDAASRCGLMITSLNLLPLQLILFKQPRRLLALIPSRAHNSHSAYGGLIFEKLIVSGKL